MAALRHLLHNSFDIPLTFQWTVVNPTVKTTSQLEEFCIETTGLSLRTWGNPVSRAHGEEVAFSSCGPPTEDNIWSQSSDW